jgi:hypothetical protein
MSQRRYALFGFSPDGATFVVASSPSVVIFRCNTAGRRLPPLPFTPDMRQLRMSTSGMAMYKYVPDGAEAGDTARSAPRRGPDNRPLTRLIVPEGASGCAVAFVRSDGLAPEPPADRAGTGPVWLYNEVPACQVLPWRGSKEVRAIADPELGMPATFSIPGRTTWSVR